MSAHDLLGPDASEFAAQVWIFAVASELEASYRKRLA
jgi:hypothetical protein